jgi:hypothetical protein
MGIHRLDLSGQRFGRLTAIEMIGPNRNKQIVWRCVCDCGNETFVTATVLHRGAVRSCGCLRRDTTRKNKTIHGHRYERLYGIWKNMIKRCHLETDRSYGRYGERGISVCDEWRNSYDNFRDWSYENGYEDDLSIDRMDNDGNYSPNNCRWTDRFTQANNTRRSRPITYDDITHSISEWSRLFGVNRHSLRYRIEHGNMRDFENYFANHDL